MNVLFFPYIRILTIRMLNFMLLNLKKYLSFICLLFISFLFFQCNSGNTDRKEESAALKATELKIEPNKPLSDYRPNITGQLSKFKLIENINDIKDYEINYVDLYNSYFIQGRGVNAEGNSLLFRQEIALKKLKDGSQIINFGPGTDPISETCTGVNCSHCSFAAEGGCDCSTGIDPNKPSGCNHTITKG